MTQSGTDYVGNMEYSSWLGTSGKVYNLQRVHNAEGYANTFNSSYVSTNFFYFRRDHLGNTREVWQAPYVVYVANNFVTPGYVAQRTQYYPSGLPWAEGESPSIQPYKYNGKEFVEMNGLDETDLGQRGLHHAKMRFNTMDRFAEKYPWQSPYCFAGNNPVNYIDVNGDSTAVLNMGSGTDQHMAMLVQNDKGKWQYYSLNGDWVYKLTDGLAGGKPYPDLGTKAFDSPEDFLQSSYNSKGDEKQIKDNTVDNYAFSEAYVLPTTPEQDNKIRDTFIDAVNDGYGLITNQCAQSIQKAFNSAGVETSVTTTRTVTDRQHGDIYQVTTKTNPYLPSTTFKAIITNNPNGFYIRRR